MNRQTKTASPLSVCWTPLLAGAAIAVLAGATPKTAAAQSAGAVYTACYAAGGGGSSGSVYRIDKPVGSAPGAPNACTNPNHVEFSWNEKGIKGDKGDAGLQGPQGVQGVKGEKGDKGEQGIQGEKGDKGDTGATGLQGPKGDQGLQ
jgi:hypothetical protein